MNEKNKILEMLAQGKVTVSEAERLLDAIGQDTSVELQPSVCSAASKEPKYIRVQVQSEKKENGKKEHVNIKIPFQILRSGIKLAALLPADAQAKVNSALKEKGLDFDMTKINAAGLDEFIQQLSEVSVDVVGDGETVRVYCE